MNDGDESVTGVFCNQCGNRNPVGANFCSSCGAVAGGVHVGPGWPQVPWWHNSGMAGRRRASGRRAGLDLGCGGRMTVVEGILLAVSIAVFLYLGVAMFKPEWF